MKILAQNSCSLSLWHGVVGPVLRSALNSALKHGTNTQFGRPRPLPVRPGRALPRIFSGGSDGLSSPLMPASINSDINSIHQAYCEATGYNVPLMPYFERQWFEALKYGLTCDCVKLVIKERLRRVREQVRKPECLLLRNVAGSEGAICDVLQEAAAIQARMRIKVVNPGKTQVLRATGRSDEPPSEPCRSMSEVIAQMRRATG